MCSSPERGPLPRGSNASRCSALRAAPTRGASAASQRGGKLRFRFGPGASRRMAFGHREFFIGFSFFVPRRCAPDGQSAVGNSAALGTAAAGAPLRGERRAFGASGRFAAVGFCPGASRRTAFGRREFLLRRQRCAGHCFGASRRAAFAATQ